MGLFDFLKDVGKKLTPGREAEEIERDILESLGAHVEHLGVDYQDGTVTLTGSVADVRTREKAVLLAGNVEGVNNVNDLLMIKLSPADVAAAQAEAQAEAEAAAPVFYQVKSGDSLSKIAKEVYGDAMKWTALFEENKEVIKDPDLIYPGQQIRIPKL